MYKFNFLWLKSLTRIWIRIGFNAVAIHCFIVYRAYLSNDQQMNYLLAWFQDWSDLFYCVQGGPVQRSADELPAGLVPGLVRPAAWGLCGRARGVSVQQARCSTPQRAAQRDGGLELQVRYLLGDISVRYGTLQYGTTTVPNPTVPVPTDYSTMLGIRDIFVRIRFRGSAYLTNGAGSGSPKNIRIRIPNTAIVPTFLGTFLKYCIAL